MGNLKDFLQNRMKMTGPYQPSIIKELLKNDGRLPIDILAAAIGTSRKVLLIYPKQTLEKHGIALIIGRDFVLTCKPKATEIGELIALCDSKLKAWAATHPNWAKK